MQRTQWSDHLTDRVARIQEQENGPWGNDKERGLPLEAIEPRRLYRQIADQLRQLIDHGEYPVGSRLPTERELADMGILDSEPHGW